jgi:hypothetical protein
MANTRLELDMTKFISQQIATAAAHVIKAKELFGAVKSVLDSAGSFVDQSPLTGLTTEQAESLYTVVSNAVFNVGTAATEMPKILMGVEV